MPDLPQLLDSVDEKLEELGRRNAYRELLFSFITGIDIQRNSTLLMAYRSLHWEGATRNMAMDMELEDWVYSMARYDMNRNFQMQLIICTA